MKGKRNIMNGCAWKEPLANADRSTLNGFTRYWSKRTNYFRELYGTQFNKKHTQEAFQDAMSINWRNLYHA